MRSHRVPCQNRHYGEMVPTWGYQTLLSYQS